MSDSAPSAGGRERTRERFEQATEIPLLVLAVLMVPLLVVPLFVDLPAGVQTTFVVFDWLIWAVFAVQFGVRLALTTRRRRFLRREWVDLVIVVVPLLRPLRVVRSTRLLRLLRLTRLGAFLGRVGKDARRLLTRHKLHYAVIGITVIILGAGAAVAVLERNHDGAIEGFGDALWWALLTVVTVSYGNAHPTTGAGRGIGVTLMLVGIAFFGVVTANLASFFVERPPEIVDAGDGAGGDPLNQLAKLADLHDRGVVTSAEFEAKKADLLARL